MFSHFLVLGLNFFLGPNTVLPGSVKLPHHLPAFPTALFTAVMALANVVKAPAIVSSVDWLLPALSLLNDLNRFSNEINIVLIAAPSLAAGEFLSLAMPSKPCLTTPKNGMS